MSASVTVSKDVDIQIDFVKCQECSDELEFVMESDSHGDIQVYVEPCKFCIDDGKEKESE